MGRSKQGKREGEDGGIEGKGKGKERRDGGRRERVITLFAMNSV